VCVCVCVEGGRQRTYIHVTSTTPHRDHQFFIRHMYVSSNIYHLVAAVSRAARPCRARGAGRPRTPGRRGAPIIGVVVVVVCEREKESVHIYIIYICVCVSIDEREEI
jgi:hypothetical protein